MYYVYVHRLRHNGEVFYVGKGKGYRKTCKQGRNAWWKRIANKYQYDVEIVEKDLQEWYAFELEAALISLYGFRRDGTGTLVNLTDGGEGSSGLKRSEESKRRISEILTGKSPRKEIYKLENCVTGEIFIGTTMQAAKELKVPISQLLKGSIIKDWFIREHVIKNNRVRNHPAIYKFKNLITGEIFEGRRVDFKRHTNVDPNKIFSEKCKNKTAKGWVVLELLEDPLKEN